MASSKTAFPCLVFVLLLSIISFSEAREFRVGGKNSSWVIPSSPDEFNVWAGGIRFVIGDTIVLKYNAKTDSVLEVTEENYKTCNKSNPIKSYNDGNTKIMLDRSGPFFFISGAEGHCEKGQKLEIRVLSPRHFPPGPAPAPSPVDKQQPPASAAAPQQNSVSRLSGAFMGGVALAGILALI